MKGERVAMFDRRLRKKLMIRGSNYYMVISTVCHLVGVQKISTPFSELRILLSPKVGSENRSIRDFF